MQLFWTNVKTYCKLLFCDFEFILKKKWAFAEYFIIISNNFGPY